MTNGEKFKEVFGISQVDEGELYAFAWLPNHDAAAEFCIDWWNAEYKAKGFLPKFNKIRKTITPQEPRWISVSERLPKAGEYIGDVERYYLVQNEYGDMLVARYTHSGYWEQIYQLKPIGDKIVAWMPLPKPYKPQESEG